MAKTPKKSGANAMWGGGFSVAPAEILAQINASVDVDKRLYREDIAGSIAHAEMLAAQGILSAGDAKKIVGGLQDIRAQIDAGKFEFKAALEDVHMNIESALKDAIGEAAGRLHTARSRNDQVATDFKLWVRGALLEIDAALKGLQAALVLRAGEHAETIMPGFTHLQIAQGITLGHHLLAYVEMFGRDRARAVDAHARAGECPLGAAALAGTSYPIDREATATALGFTRPMANSLDAVSDRDFALELLSVASIASVHLTRLSEEFIIWCSQPFGFIRFSDAFSTGSSIMPQKRNPDAAELVRGKSGRIIGHLTGLLVTLKSLPLAYNKDMQEDKEPVFDAVQQILLCIAAMTGMVRDFTANEARMLALAEEGYANATDLADWLVQELKLPFREAHHVSAKLVALASKDGKKLQALTLAELQKIHRGIHKGIYTVLDARTSVARRVSFGGTAPKRVKEAVALAKKRFGL